MNSIFSIITYIGRSYVFVVVGLNGAQNNILTKYVWGVYIYVIRCSCNSIQNKNGMSGTFILQRIYVRSSSCVYKYKCLHQLYNDCVHPHLFDVSPRRKLKGLESLTYYSLVKASLCLCFTAMFT